MHLNISLNFIDVTGKDDEEEKKEEEVGQSVREDDNEDEKPEEEDNKDLGNEEVETSGDAQVDEGREEESKSPLPQVRNS